MRLLGIILFLASSFQATASDLVKHDHMPSAEQRRQSKAWNQIPFQTLMTVPSTSVARPFSEVETTGYVMIAAENTFELADLRLAIAQNLPAGVTLVVYVTDPSQVQPVEQALGGYLGNRLKFLNIDSTGDAMWARDSLPFPVYASSTSFGLVGSLYPQKFDPDQSVAQALALPLTSTGIYFRGGNLLLDEKGNCFAEIANEVSDMSDPHGFFTQFFGCSSVTLLEQQGGIGDIDERIKFLTGFDVLTDNDSYAAILSTKGYTVHRIPETGVPYETYMNTLYVNGTIFVPQMGLPSDQAALAAYTALGFKAVGVNTKSMADDGHGNIHCVTMNYPPGYFAPSVRGAEYLEFADAMGSF